MSDKLSNNVLAASGKAGNEKAYWQEKLEGEPVMSAFPSERRASGVGGTTVFMSFSLSSDISDRLTYMSKGSDYALFMIFAAGVHILLSKYTNSPDVVTGMPVFQQEDEESRAGNKLLILRTSLQNCRNFKDALMATKQSITEANDHQNYPLHHMMKHGNLLPEHDGEPLIRTLVGFDRIQDLGQAQDGTAEVAVLLISLDGSLRVDFSFDKSRFELESVRRWAVHLERLLETALFRPEEPLSEIEMLERHEFETLAYGFNRTKAEYDQHTTLHRLFEEQAARTPERTAAVFGADGMERLTYRELNERANQLARTLRDKGVKPGRLVGVLLERSPEMMVGILAILKAGGAYVPIDPAYPEERIAYLLRDSGAELLLTCKRELPPGQFSGEQLDLADETLYSGDGEDLSATSGPHDLSYVIYTSGSTGEPKGVMIEHHSVINRLQWMQRRFPLAEDDVIMQKTPFSFDVSVWELFWWGMQGASAVFPEPGAEKNPESIARCVERHRVTVMHFVPSMLQLFLEHVEEAGDTGRLRTLRRVFASGEALQAKQASRFGRLLKDAWGTELVNLYGPTEATVDVSYHNCSCVEESARIPIGQPIDNISLYVLDGHRRLQPVGVPGELYIAGVGLARGYWNRPELTAERFVDNPFAPGERMYRTGDLARWLPNGEVEYLGRIDHQVKIRGYRIEPGEIETQLLRHERIREAAVTVRPGEAGLKDLCAYYVADGDLEAGEVRAYLAERLPSYMVPAYLVALEAMPLTPNGKLNRKALPAPEENVEREAYVAPRNELERQLAAVWQEVLGFERIGIDDHFFHMGGDSIKAIQASAQLMTIGLAMQVKDLFEKPTIRFLSPLIGQHTRAVDQGPVEGAAVLAPIQHWFFDRHATDIHHFNQSLLMQAASELNPEWVREAAAKLVEHHDALRMTFAQKEGEWIPFNRGLSGERSFEFRIHDFRDVPQEELAARMDEEADRYQSSMELSEGPLCKVVLFQTARKDYLLFVIHHLVVDGYSWRILMEDFQTGYMQLSRNETIRLPEKTDSYVLWAERIRAYANMPDRMRKSSEYWRGFTQSPVVPLPVDRPLTRRRGHHMQAVTLTFQADVTELLLTAANRAYHTDTNDLLLAALGLAVNEWTGEDHVWIQLEGHGREELFQEVNINRTVGWFTSMYPVLLPAQSHSDELSGLIKAVKECLRGIPDKGIGYGMLRYLTLDDLPEIEPEICFNYLGQFDQRQSSDLLTVSDLPSGHTVSPNVECPFTIDINGIVKDGELVLTFRYDREEYDESTIQRFVSAYEQHLGRLVSHCVDKRDSDFTPSDFSATGLDMDDLADVFQALENKF